MPNAVSQRPGFFSRMGGRLRDNIALGRNYDPKTGEFHATPGQWIGGIGAKLAGLIVPGAGQLINGAYNGYHDGTGPLKFLHGNSGQPGDPSRSQFPVDPHYDFGGGDIGGQFGMGNPTFNGTDQPSGWQGPTLGQPQDPAGNPYGQDWGAFTPSFLGGGARPIGGALSFGGGRSGYNNGVGAGTGFGASSFQNDGFGDMAAGFGVGAQGSGGSSGGSFALADAMAQQKKNRV